MGYCLLADPQISKVSGQIYTARHVLGITLKRLCMVLRKMRLAYVCHTNTVYGHHNQDLKEDFLDMNYLLGGLSSSVPNTSSAIVSSLSASSLLAKAKRGKHTCSSLHSPCRIECLSDSRGENSVTVISDKAE